MKATYTFYFAEPGWLLGLILLVPIVWLALRSLAALSPGRRTAAILLRGIIVTLLVGILARPMFARKNEQLCLVAVRDRSQSVPVALVDESLEFLDEALEQRGERDLLAVVDVAEAASISKLPSTHMEVEERNTNLTGEETNLARGVQMAMAIAPPDTATRILLVSDGNETGGDLREAARTAAANGIAIDVLPLRYKYAHEVVFNRLVAPSTVARGQTVGMRFVLNSTATVQGRLSMSVNGEVIDLAPGSAEVAAPVQLEPGTNVKTISLPMGTRGMHRLEAEFVPDEVGADVVTQNNRATAMVQVAGPGQVMVVDADGKAGEALARALQKSEMEVRYGSIADFPDDLAALMGTDAVILANTDVSQITFVQQEMLCRYVKDLGGGLIMVGGPQSFGAGGWIGSSVAEIMPVDFDPPQKKQLPKGALVLIMHACEMPRGNYWGQRIAASAVNTLSRLDLVGILAYGWQGQGDWVFPLGPVGDKEALVKSINKMQMGDMPSLHDHMQKAYDALKDCDAAQKHVIVISDGDPQPPTKALLKDFKDAGITCTGVGIFPHSPADVQSLLRVAKETGGRFYDVKDPKMLPKIFIKEAQVVRRALIVEETFSPQLTYGFSEITRGLNYLPNLDGYVLTGPKGGLAQMVLASAKGDPILATCQSGLGRCVAFTSSADSRWAGGWLGWDGFERFWEQTVRWAGKSDTGDPQCEVFTDVQGRRVTVNVEAIDTEGRFLAMAGIEGQVISPSMGSEVMELEQVGPGQFQGSFQADVSGSYVVNLRYRETGEDARTRVKRAVVSIPFGPEFRDLSDNLPLLLQVSELTGGRVIDSDPELAGLFDRSGIKFPVTQVPLARWLMFVWLGLFLLDVAVRRIAVDFAAGWRRAMAWVRRKRVVGGDATLERLKSSRQKLWQQRAASGADDSGKRRYVANEEYEGQLPSADVAAPAEKPREPAAEEPVADKSDDDQDQSHIQRLLRAKRQSRDKDQ